MRTPKPKTEFQKLQDKWYKKLEKSGFHDIESDEDNLKVWSSIFFERHPLGVWQAKQAYYQMAENFLTEYKFDDNIEKVIWEYHSNGIGNRDIAKTFKKAKLRKRTNKDTIRKIVNKLKAKMYTMYMEPKKEYHE